ncbi:hypothetical protein JYU34_019851 [Plutella xylostella]|uniref:Uncharacterized protein n=1 Tax=Plutella xylostella TaxID=51655 RepID=A0ABQ7PVE2_PLUXY|nr:hypothetical protein JYU34_019851 [Plutella xylostella]
MDLQNILAVPDKTHCETTKQAYLFHIVTNQEGKRILDASEIIRKSPDEPEVWRSINTGYRLRRFQAYAKGVKVGMSTLHCWFAARDGTKTVSQTFVGS